MLAADWLPRALGFAGRTFLFAAGDEANGVELWSTDGTVAGTTMIADIAAGASNSFPSSAATRGDRVLFFADDGEHGREPWLSDGSAAGTVLLADIQPGPFGSRDRWDPEPKAIGNAFVFAAADGAHGFELWQSDGTASGTTMVQDIASDARSSTPQSFIVSGDHLFFTANDNVHGRELWAMPLAAIACAPNCPDPRTPSPTPRRTPRPIWTPGEVLPTYTPTPFPTRATTPQHCFAPGDGEDCVFLNVGSASGEPGDVVEIDVRFRTGGLPVAGVQLDLLSSDDLPFVPGDDGKPVCHVNPDIHKDYSAFSDPFHDSTRARALILSVENVDPIPDDSLLFTCSFQIPAHAAPSIVPLRCSNALGSTPEGVAIPPFDAPWTGSSSGELVCSDGAVTISGGAPTPTGTPAEGDRAISASDGGDGCQLNGASAPSHSLALLLPLTLLLLRRRGR
jgi:ELWxxDGT repeat protein